MCHSHVTHANESSCQITRVAQCVMNESVCHSHVTRVNESKCHVTHVAQDVMNESMRDSHVTYVILRVTVMSHMWRSDALSHPHMRHDCDTQTHAWHVVPHAWHDTSTHSHMWHVCDSFTYVTWLIRMRDMAGSYMWHDSLTHSHMWHDCHVTRVNELMRHVTRMKACDMTH